MVFDTVKLVLWGAIALAIAAHWGHYKYLDNKVENLQTDIKVLKAKHAERENQFAQALKDWNSQVSKRSKELERAKKEKKETVDKHKRELEDIFKEREDTRKELDAAIKKVKDVKQVIVAPAYFRMFYDISAVGGAETSAGPGRIRVPELPPGTLSKTETFDANAVTEVVVAKNLQCREDQARLNKLIDVIEELERKKNDISRPNGKVAND
jgi:predicted phage tail protein